MPLGLHLRARKRPPKDNRNRKNRFDLAKMHVTLPTVGEQYLDADAVDSGCNPAHETPRDASAASGGRRVQVPWVSVIIQLAAIHLEYTEHVMVIIHMERDKGTRYRAVPLVGPISTYTMKTYPG